MARSCFLFHGPGARQAALGYSNATGRLIAPPFGDEGLGVQDAREAVELLASIPVGNLTGFVVLGPMEQATPQAIDALLMTVEEVP